MRVLVTRPHPSAEATASRIRQKGHQPILMALFDAHHHLTILYDAPAPDTGGIAVTSAEAIRAFMSLPDTIRRHYRHIPLFAVGAATADLAKNAGFSKIHIGRADGAALAQLVETTLDPSARKRLLYLAGRPRSPDFELALKASGYLIDVRECYSMAAAEPDPVQLAELKKTPPNCILLYSSETARQCLSVLDIETQSAKWNNVRFLCLSEKIASTLPANLKSQALWPAEPREELLLELL